MKRVYNILMVIALLISMSACKESVETEQIDYSNELAELELKVDKQKYIEAFSEVLNNTENLDNELISNSLINSQLPEYTSDTEMDMPDPSDESVDIEEDPDGQEQTEFPIIDIDGDIIGYGTKEESDKSYEIFSEAPYYRVESIDIYMDTIIFTVHNKGLNSLQVFEVELNEEMQIESYKLLGG